MTDVIVLAGEFEDIGNHLFGIGTGWAQKALYLGLVAIVAVTVIRRFSLKAGIGALLGMVLCLGIYNSREELADAFSSEINNTGSGPAVVHVVDSPPPGSPDSPGSARLSVGEWGRGGSS